MSPTGNLHPKPHALLISRPYGRLPLEVPLAEWGEGHPVRFESAGYLTEFSLSDAWRARLCFLRAAEVRIEVEPNFDISWGAPGGESLFREAPGFRITETNYFKYPEYDTSEREHTLESEQEVAEYLIQTVAEKVAHYRHLASIRAKQDQKK